MATPVSQLKSFDEFLKDLGIVSTQVFTKDEKEYVTVHFFDGTSRTVEIGDAESEDSYDD